jgi:hypothetical protein
VSDVFENGVTTRNKPVGSSVKHATIVGQRFPDKLEFSPPSPPPSPLPI